MGLDRSEASRTVVCWLCVGVNPGPGSVCVVCVLCVCCVLCVFSVCEMKGSHCIKKWNQ